jgi:hypothetical protein
MGYFYLMLQSCGLKPARIRGNKIPDKIALLQNKAKGKV